jgi:nicotinamidase-related amidase
MTKEQHVIIIDMQQKFLTDKKPEDVANKTHVIYDILTQCEKLHIPVTYAMCPEDDFGPIIDEIKPYDLSHIVVKTESDAFSSSEFRNRIRFARTLYFAGCNLDVCVKLTVESAIRRGYKAVLFKDALLAQDSSRDLACKTYFGLFFNPSITITNYKSKKMLR